MLIHFLSLTLDSKTDCAQWHIALHIRYLLQKFHLHSLLVAVQLKSTKLFLVDINQKYLYRIPFTRIKNEKRTDVEF